MPRPATGTATLQPPSPGRASLWTSAPSPCRLHRPAARSGAVQLWRASTSADEDREVTAAEWTRFCIEEYFGGSPEQSGIYMTPTYGNTLMGLACSKPVTAEEGYKISYYAPQPRAVAEVVDFDDPLKLVPYGESGRVKLTTLTKELFIPGFLERDEGEREKPYAKYPWDGVSGVKPWRGIAAQTTVGVY